MRIARPRPAPCRLAPCRRAPCRLAPCRLAPWLVCAACVLGTAGATAHAKFLLAVKTGWGGKIRAGRWTPVFVTMGDPSAPPQGRRVGLSFHAPYGDAAAMQIQETMRVQSFPQTWTVFSPLNLNYTKAVLSVQDAETRRKLAEETMGDEYSYSFRGGAEVGPSALFVAVSGVPSPGLSVGARNGEAGAVVYEPPARLPTVARGYDSLDVLVLNQPDFKKLDPRAQEAVADWVRAGGNLVFQPGDDPLPPSGPLVDLLPGRVGEVRTLGVAVPVLQSAGLPPRFAQMLAHDVRPAPGAGVTRFFNDDRAVAVRGRRGMGQVVLLSFDACGLVFADPARAVGFWRDVLGGVTEMSEGDNAGRGSYNGTWQDARRAGAIGQTMDVLGSVPGVGRFDFKYIAVVLLAMMVIVGPVDWFVLKALRRQPWTWATTAGWVGLITVGAIYIGHVFRSGELYYRTLRVVDQADGGAVASIEVAGIYSPKTTEYTLDTQPGSWWEPVTAQTNSYRNGPVTLIPCKQDLRYDFNSPDEFQVNVWNLKFMAGETIRPGPPLLEASLSLKSLPPQQAKLPPGATTWPNGAGRVVPMRLEGTITNRTDYAMRNVYVRARGGIAAAGDAVALPTFHNQPQNGYYYDQFGNYRNTPPPDEPAVTVADVPPHATVNVRAVLGPYAGFFADAQGPSNAYGGYAYGGSPSGPNPLADANPLWLIRAGCGLSTPRYDQVERLLINDPNLACVYAESEIPAPATALKSDLKALEKHWQVVRALVRLKD